MDSIKDAIQTCAGKEGLVWITMINNGYVDYTKNFLKAMDVYGSAFTLLVYCLDSESLQSLSNQPHCIALDAKTFLKQTQPTALSIWGELNYKRIVFSKLDAIHFTMTLCSELKIPFIGYIDTDIIPLKNPTPYILNEMKEHPSAVLVCQCDESTASCSNKDSCKNLCTGVIGFRVGSLPEKVFQYSEKEIRSFMSDQHFLQDQLLKNKYAFRTIDKSIFLNGSYPGLKSGKQITFPLTASLVHFNYIVDKNYAKRETMKVQRMWFV